MRAFSRIMTGAPARRKRGLNAYGEFYRPIDDLTAYGTGPE